MGANNLHTDAYLRVASLSIALYDYVLTLPAEWRFYSSQTSITSPSLACVLFFLIRYTSILVLTISNYGFFVHDFTPESCQHFFWAAPVLKVVQTMVSQAILGVRTVNIARRTPWVIWVVGLLFTIVTVLEWFTNLYHRDPTSLNGNCAPGNDPTHLSAWTYYLLSTVYDLVTLAISTAFLYQLNTQDSWKRFSRLLNILFYDGLVYFVVLTGSNVLNMILYQTSNQSIQSSGASLGYAVALIMSQRVLINLREMAAKLNSQPDSIMMGNPITQKAAKARQSRFDTRTSVMEASSAMRPPEVKLDADVELAVRVHVDQTTQASVSANYSQQDDEDRKPGFA